MPAWFGTDLLWWLLFASMLQPLLTRRLLTNARVQLRTQVEATRGSRVILLVHRQETMSFFGVPLMRYIDVEDSEQVIRAILETEPDRPIDIVLHTPGGLVLAALQIARALCRHRGTVTAFVPHYAMSGGTLIALAADRIVMCEHAVLGPVDPLLDGYPAASIRRAVARKDDKDVDDNTLILDDQAGMALDQVRRAVSSLLAGRLREDLIEHVASALSEGQWTHDYPITSDEAAALGLPVDTAMPDEIMKMISLYPAPKGRPPSVEYGRNSGRRGRRYPVTPADSPPPVQRG